MTRFSNLTESLDKALEAISNSKAVVSGMTKEETENLSEALKIDARRLLTDIRKTLDQIEGELK